MAEHHFLIVPVDPSYRPDPAAIEAAEEFVRALIPGAEEVRGSRYPGIQFFDAGEGFEEPRCPRCDADTAPWWSEAMSAAWDGSQFGDLRIAMPCCGAHTTLDRLRYPNGDRFASFVLEAALADPHETLSPAQLAQLETMLGAPLVAAWVSR